MQKALVADKITGTTVHPKVAEASLYLAEALRFSDYFSVWAISCSFYRRNQS